MKKAISLLLIFVMICVSLSVSAEAEGATIITERNNKVALSISIVGSSEKLALIAKWSNLAADSTFAWNNAIEFTSAKLNPGSSLDSYRIRFRMLNKDVLSSIQGITKAGKLITFSANGTSSGYTQYVGRTDAGDAFINITMSLTHTHNFETVSKFTEPTCTEPAYQIIGECSYCASQNKFSLYNENSPRTKEMYAPLGHAWGEWQQVAQATCLQEGSEYRICSRDASHIEHRTLPLAEHQWEEWQTIQENDCTHDGVKVRICALSGEHVQEQTVPATGHRFIANVKAADCRQEGYTSFVCEACGESYIDEDSYTPKLSHDYGSWQTAVNPQNETAGLQKSVCRRCEQIQWNPLPAFSLNKYYSPEEEYDYAARGASLRVDEKNAQYKGEATTQALRFTGSVLLPENTALEQNGNSDILIKDFGFVYTQSQKIHGDISLLKEGQAEVFRLSLAQKNGDLGNLNKLKGATLHSDVAGTHLTFNLVLNIQAVNWEREYCARAYITFESNGVEYTVYDSQAASKSVAEIARQVCANEQESTFAQEYCKHKILEHL